MTTNVCCWDLFERTNSGKTWITCGGVSGAKIWISCHSNIWTIWFDWLTGEEENGKRKWGKVGQAGWIEKWRFSFGEANFERKRVCKLLKLADLREREREQMHAPLLHLKSERCRNEKHADGEVEVTRKKTLLMMNESDQVMNKDRRLSDRSFSDHARKDES